MRSDKMKKGLEKAPHRSLFSAMGCLPEELERPIIGIANSANELIPGHIHLDRVCQAVKDGIITQAQADLVLANASSKGIGGFLSLGGMHGDPGDSGGGHGGGRHGGGHIENAPLDSSADHLESTATP